MSDWTLNNNTLPISPGNTIVSTTNYRNNTTNGTTDQHNAYLFATADIALEDQGTALAARVQSSVDHPPG